MIENFLFYLRKRQHIATLCFSFDEGPK